MLSKVKGGRSFSETIKNCLDRKVQAREIMKFAGILKDKHKELDELNRKIADDRRRNPGRKFDW